MILPTFVAISREVISVVPNDLMEASLSLGATRWQVIREVVLPTAKIGLFGATFLALARATGETVAVALVAGGVANVQFHLLYPGTSIASWIATEFGEAQGNEIAALMALGVLLMLVNFGLSLDQPLAGHSSAKGPGGRMSDMIELTEIGAIRTTPCATRSARSRTAIAPGASCVRGSWSILCAIALAVTAVPLLLLLYQLFKRGLPVVLHSAFYTQLPQTPTLIAPNATGGVSNAIIGTLVLTAYASIMAIPIGVLVGIYLAESDSKLAASLRVTAQTMAGAPSILMGLFAFSFIVHDLNIGFSAIAGSFALAVLMLPVIVIASEIAVRGVPHTLREAGLALGAKPHKVSHEDRPASGGDRHRDRHHPGDVSRHRRDGSSAFGHRRRLH